MGRADCSLEVQDSKAVDLLLLTVRKARRRAEEKRAYEEASRQVHVSAISKVRYSYI